MIISQHNDNNYAMAVLEQSKNLKLEVERNIFFEISHGSIVSFGTVLAI